MTKKQIKGIMSKKSDHWKTPNQLLKRIKFDKDVCPFMNDINEYDGLSDDWSKYNLVFCNPPYSDIKTWITYLIEQCKNGEVRGYLLVPARTDTKWFHQLVNSGFVISIDFLKGRLRFNEKLGAPFPSILVYFSTYSYLHSPLLKFNDSNSDIFYT